MADEREPGAGHDGSDAGQHLVDEDPRGAHVRRVGEGRRVEHQRLPHGRVPQQRAGDVDDVRDEHRVRAEDVSLERAARRDLVDVGEDALLEDAVASAVRRSSASR